MYCKVVYAYTDHQALEHLIKLNRAYRQYNARLTRYLERLAHLDIPKRHAAGKNQTLADYLSRHPTEEATTEENHDEEYVINTVSELFKLNQKYGQILNTDQKFLSTGQWANMTLKTNQELTNQFASPKKFIPTVDSKNSTREQA